MTANAEQNGGTPQPYEERDFGDGHPYRVVPDRLVQVEGRDYVRCPTHDLIPLDHYCAESPHDHWCRTAAHPAYDPATGEDGLDDQGTSHRDWSHVQAEKVRRLADALLTACLYLDGFVWLDDPEASEMDEMKATVAEALGCQNWEQAKELADLREARRGD